MCSKHRLMLAGIIAISLTCSSLILSAKAHISLSFDKGIGGIYSFSTLVNKKWISPKDLVSFALSLKGIPYKYGASNPKIGFDCSGFVHYVFKHFAINVPRTSAGFKDSGKKVPVEDATAGDLILFTGTNSKIRRIGHIGIVISKTGEPLRFIHASSGSAHAVTETMLNKRYQQRLIKVIRLDEIN